MSIELSRRSFLRGVLALSVTPALAKLPMLPTIYGDGVHDDLPGLQAMIDGEPFHIENGGFVASEGEISGGQFILSRTLRIGRALARLNISDCRISTTPDFQDSAIIQVEPDARLFLNNINIWNRFAGLEASAVRFEV